MTNNRPNDNDYYLFPQTHKVSKLVLNINLKTQLTNNT
jgi:hypothetical protein